MDGLPAMTSSDNPLISGPKFEWVTASHGWVTFSLTGGSNRYRCTVADSSDVMSDLLISVAAMVRGALRLQISLDHEPAEVRWTFQRAGESVKVSIAHLDSWGAGDSVEPRWAGDWTDVRTLGLNFLTATQRFLEGIGLENYKKEWPSYPVAEDSLAFLRESLSLKR